MADKPVGDESRESVGVPEVREVRGIRPKSEIAVGWGAGTLNLPR